jgi:16S rRNA (guanine1516-N2)-methyltransferase
VSTPTSLSTSNNESFSVEVLALSPADERAASALAEELVLPLCQTGIDVRDYVAAQMLLICSEQEIILQQTGRSAPGPITVQFGNAAMRHRRRGGHNELLGKAVGLSRKSGIAVLDATAGLGRDSFILADLGCRVWLCERNDLVFHMLASGLNKAAKSSDEWLRAVVHRMSLFSGDARELADSQLHVAEVIYLDPMFPEREKRAKVKKEMAIFHQLLGAGEDSDELLTWALQQDVARVVVKRPPKAPQLAGLKPSHVIAGKAVRYDVYVLRGL